MIDTQRVIAIAEAQMAGSDMFVVGCKCTPMNEVELLIDSDSSIAIDACITLSRAIEGEFDREVEDFALTVASAGIGSELKLLRQYAKLIGREGSVEVLLLSGVKVVGRLLEADDLGVKVSYEQKQVVESASGKKKRVMVVVEQRYEFDEIKNVKEYLDFK
ncbi:MAG: ribosome assembly cofactor RimP [Rikenellaceae bacterium]